MPDSNNYSPVITNNLAAVIASGASLSAAVDISGTTLVGYIMPAAWTAADISFQVSADGTNFYNFYDNLGNEITNVVASSRFVALNPAGFASVRYIKFRSGTNASAVNQAAERSINLVTRAI